MPNELTREHAKLLYDLATNSRRTGNLVHTIQVMEKLVEINEPFYTPFALAAQSDCYNALGRRDLETATFKRVIGLPEEQQQLLNPAYLALCYQRLGDLKSAKKIHTELLELTPNDPLVIGALAEISLLEHRLEEAEHWASKLRARGEAPYQTLGRMIGALVMILNRRGDEAGKELQWVGQFLMSTGSIQLQAWDYRDLQPMATEITGPPRPGISGMLHSLFEA